MKVIFRDMGNMEYLQALQLQEDLIKERRKHRNGANYLLLGTHPPTITIGRRGSPEDILVSEEILREEGITVFQINRGGMSTYHGPGQLVGYLIAKIHDLSENIEGVIKIIEKSIQDFLLVNFDIQTITKKKSPGVWIENPTRKIASIGMKITAGVTSHGFSLNLKTKQKHWDMIIPCGEVSNITSVMLEQPKANISNIKAIKKSFLQSFQKSINEKINSKPDKQ